MSKLNLKPEERIILSLDFPKIETAKDWVMKLKGRISTFKVGPILFLDSGPEGLKGINRLGVDIFLDLKFHDIPNTVKNSAMQILNYGINMFTIHTLGGFEMMKAVVDGVNSESEKRSIKKPMVLGVTVLTSHDQKSLNDLGILGSTTDAVMKLASIAEKAGIDGIVASGSEVEILRKEFGDRFTLVVPGIRLGSETQDQRRVVTPKNAIESGADYLVIGRMVTESENPELTVDEIFDSII